MKKRKHNIFVRVPQDLKKQLDQMMEQKDTTLAYILRQELEQMAKELKIV